MVKTIDLSSRPQDWPGRGQTWKLLTPAEFEKLKPKMQHAAPPPAPDQSEANGHVPEREPDSHPRDFEPPPPNDTVVDDR